MNCGVRLPIQATLCPVCEEPLQGSEAECPECGIDLQAHPATRLGDDTPADSNQEAPLPAKEIHAPTVVDLPPLQGLDDSPRAGDKEETTAAASVDDQTAMTESSFEMDAEIIDQPSSLPVDELLPSMDDVESDLSSEGDDIDTGSGPEGAATELPVLEPISPSEPGDNREPDAELEQETEQPSPPDAVTADLLSLDFEEHVPTAPTVDAAETAFEQLAKAPPISPTPGGAEVRAEGAKRKKGLYKETSWIGKAFKWAVGLLLVLALSGAVTLFAVQWVYPEWYEDRQIYVRMLWEKYIEQKEVSLQSQPLNFAPTDPKPLPIRKFSWLSCRSIVNWRKKRKTIKPYGNCSRSLNRNKTISFVVFSRPSRTRTSPPTALPSSISRYSTFIFRLRRQEPRSTKEPIRMPRPWRCASY